MPMAEVVLLVRDDFFVLMSFKSLASHTNTPAQAVPNPWTQRELGHLFAVFHSHG
jgi:hypothetical protein